MKCDPKRLKELGVHLGHVNRGLKRCNVGAALKRHDMLFQLRYDHAIGAGHNLNWATSMGLDLPMTVD